SILGSHVPGPLCRSSHKDVTGRTRRRPAGGNQQAQFEPQCAASNYFSQENICFQSFFMLITVQPFALASSYKACVKVPTLESGSPCAGPYAYSRVASSWSTSISSEAPPLAWVYSSICRSPVELPNAALGCFPMKR